MTTQSPVLLQFPPLMHTNWLERAIRRRPPVFNYVRREGPASFLNELQIKLARSGPPPVRAGVNQRQPAELHQGKQGPACPRVPSHPGRATVGWPGQLLPSFFPPVSTIPWSIMGNTSVFHSLPSV